MIERFGVGDRVRVKWMAGTDYSPFGTVVASPETSEWLKVLDWLKVRMDEGVDPAYSTKTPALFPVNDCERICPDESPCPCCEFTYADGSEESIGKVDAARGAVIAACVGFVTAYDDERNNADEVAYWINEQRAAVKRLKAEEAND